MALGRPTARSAARPRASIVALLAFLALLHIGCQPTILSTISCPVYQPPQTPLPEWPKECGGTR